MQCPNKKCGALNSHTYDSHMFLTTRQRWRECQQCYSRWKSAESVLDNTIVRCPESRQHLFPAKECKTINDCFANSIVKPGGVQIFFTHKHRWRVCKCCGTEFQTEERLIEGTLELSSWEPVQKKLEFNTKGAVKTK